MLLGGHGGPVRSVPRAEPEGRPHDDSAGGEARAGTAPSPIAERRMLSLPMAAELLGISLRTLRCLIERQQLKVVRVSPHRVVVDRKDLEAYIEAQRS